MAQITLKGNPFNTSGDLPAVGSTAPDFNLTATDLGGKTLADYKGQKVILNIFPSIDTSTCATSVREFNTKATSLDNTVVVSVSKDLPFAHSRFCAAEGIENVVTLADYKSEDFGNNYGVKIVDGPLAGLLARSIVVLDEEGKVKHTELVAETVDEPNYDAAIAAL
ncbi:MAG: thiol peroxidase [Bacteroidota bacterium]